jgi:hypothetical protein
MHMLSVHLSVNGHLLAMALRMVEAMLVSILSLTEDNSTVKLEVALVFYLENSLNAVESPRFKQTNVNGHIVPVHLSAVKLHVIHMDLIGDTLEDMMVLVAAFFQQIQK